MGVMHFVGEANRRFETDVTTIGFATYSKINNGHLLKSVSIINQSIRVLTLKVAPDESENSPKFLLRKSRKPKIERKSLRVFFCARRGF